MCYIAIFRSAFVTLLLLHAFTPFSIADNQNKQRYDIQHDGIQLHDDRRTQPIERKSGATLERHGSSDKYPAVYTKILDDDHVLGCDNASNVLIHYSSLGCIHCFLWQAMNLKTLQNYIKACKVKYVLRELPVSESAVLASKYLQCSNNFFGTFTSLLSSQMRWLNSRKQTSMIEHVLHTKNLDNSTTMHTCINAQSTKNAISTHTRYAMDKMDVRVFPTFFINGKKFEGVTSLTQMAKYMHR